MVFEACDIKMLYVEDDDGTRTMLGKLLRQKYPEITVYTAGNGKEGLALYHEHHPDLVLTDISMPVMDGMEMSAAIRNSPSQAIIIALTAHTDQDFLARSRELGFSHYILKPVKFQELFSALESSFAAIAGHCVRSQ